jgi:hypothetical protein
MAKYFLKLVVKEKCKCFCGLHAIVCPIDEKKSSGNLNNDNTQPSQYNLQYNKDYLYRTHVNLYRTEISKVQLLAVYLTLV